MSLYMSNQENNNNKHVTIDDLAVMMKKGFDGVDEQFKGVNGRLDAIKIGLENIALRLENRAYV